MRTPRLRAVPGMNWKSPCAPAVDGPLFFPKWDSAPHTP
jgi:hypothetical protein